MKTLWSRIFVIVVATFSSSVLLARGGGGGGSIIGNGAGLVENNFQIAYSNLGPLFEECLTKRSCELTPAENRIVEKMKQVFDLNKNRQDRLIFVSASQNPGFFDTGDNEKHRIAKTYLYADSSIYVNTDLLYTEDGLPALDLNQIMALVVHEMGHQAGEPSHTALDILGTKFKKVFSRKARTYTLEIGSERSHVEVTLINKTLPFAVTEVVIAWTAETSKVVTSKLISTVKCSSMSANATSYESFNGYFLEPVTTENQEVKAQFAFWLSLNCLDSASRQLSNETYSIRFGFGEKLEPEIFEVKRLKQ